MKRRAKPNPKSDATGPLLFLVTVGALIGVAYGLKYMTDQQRKSVLGV